MDFIVDEREYRIITTKEISRGSLSTDKNKLLGICKNLNDYEREDGIRHFVIESSSLDD
jgi:hypothetical protein